MEKQGRSRRSYLCSGSGCRAATTPPAFSGRNGRRATHGLGQALAPLHAALLLAARGVPPQWWRLSRCDNSARVRAGGTNGRQLTPRSRPCAAARGATPRSARSSTSVVAVVALRRLHPRSSGRNERRATHASVKPLRRCTRRYSSQREEFHLSGSSCRAATTPPAFSGRNERRATHASVKPLRRSTRCYPSQPVLRSSASNTRGGCSATAERGRDEFHHAKKIAFRRSGARTSLMINSPAVRRTYDTGRGFCVSYAP